MFNTYEVYILCLLLIIVLCSRDYLEHTGDVSDEVISSSSTGITCSFSCTELKRKLFMKFTGTLFSYWKVIKKLLLFK